MTHCWHEFSGYMIQRGDGICCREVICCHCGAVGKQWQQRRVVEQPGHGPHAPVVSALTWGPVEADGECKGKGA